MDFFSRQDDVRAKSRAFFIAFGLAVALAVVILYFVVTGCFLTLTSNPRLPLISGSVRALPWFIYGSPPRVLSLRPFLMIGTVITLIILTVSILKTRAIKEGGAAYIIVAIGGEPLDSPQNFQETQLLNVVEEMAVAAALPRPQVYLLPEDTHSINAITAGLDHDDAIIAVTKGAMNHLSREELQGVLAHEFGHILNGDYALNLTMAGWLYGLMFFYIQGQRLTKEMWQGLGLGERDDGGQIPVYICILGLIIGLILTIGGWVGQAMAGLVQLAFSRQREFLADAFAVQFTRNTAGLAGALKKIAWTPRHGALRSGQATMMRAFFIASPVRADGLFQTHPPLEDRILALEPAWDGALTAIDHQDFQPPKDLDQKYGASGYNSPQEGLRGLKPLRDLAGKMDGPSGLLLLSLLAAGGSSVGGPSSGLLTGRAQVIPATDPASPDIPDNLRAAALDPERAAAVPAAVLLMDDPNHQAAQLDIIKRFLGAETAASAAGLKAGLKNDQRLSLLALALPALKRLKPEDRTRLGQVAKALATVGGKLDLFKIAVCQMLKKPLGLTLSSASPAAVADGQGLGGYLEKMQADVVTVLSILAHLGNTDEEAARSAFTEAMNQFHQWPPMELKPKAAGGVRALVEALDRLAETPEKIKKSLALAASGLALTGPAQGREMSSREYELLAALAATLDLPQALPPSGPR